MFKSTLLPLLRRAALSLALVAASGLAGAGTLHVAIDTSGFGGAAGYLDMQLSASSGVPLATAVVSHLSGFDTDGFIDAWGVTPVADGYLFRNDVANDLYHAVDFGAVLSFDLDLGGDADPLASYVSHFVVALFDETGAALGNYDPVSGALADFSWTPASAAGGAGAVGVDIADPAVVTVVPEPGGWLLIGAGLCAMASLRRRLG
jgi:hypothetical protein